MFVTAKSTILDHLPLAGGTAIAVTPNYGFSYLTHTYNWSYVASKPFTITIFDSKQLRTSSMTSKLLL